MNHQDRRRDGSSRGQIPWARTFLWMFLVGCGTTSFYFSLSIALSMLQSFHLDFNLSFSGTKLVSWCLSQNEQRLGANVWRYTRYDLKQLNTIKIHKTKKKKRILILNSTKTSSLTKSFLKGVVKKRPKHYFPDLEGNKKGGWQNYLQKLVFCTTRGKLS